MSQQSRATNAEVRANTLSYTQTDVSIHASLDVFLLVAMPMWPMFDSQARIKLSSSSRYFGFRSANGLTVFPGPTRPPPTMTTYCGTIAVRASLEQDNDWSKRSVGRSVDAIKVAVLTSDHRFSHSLHDHKCLVSGE